MRWAAPLLVMLALGACRAGTDVAPGSDGGAPPAPVALPRPQPRPRPAPPAVTAGREVAIPTGRVLLGTQPGLEGRNPRTEANLVPVEVPPFAIDLLPYPNDPASPARTDVTRAQAAQLCAARGERLCSEIEWERACKASTRQSFPGGTSFDAERCSLRPQSCASPLGVRSLGVVVGEWTASDATRGLALGGRTAVYRGAAAADPAAAHRCGARHSAPPDSRSDTVGFRCCRGPVPPNTLTYPARPDAPMFVDAPVDTGRLRQILAGIPELSRFAADFEPFGADAVDRVLGRGGEGRAALHGWQPVTDVLRWSPGPGEEAWVVTGTGAGSSLIAVILPLGDGTFVHGASFVLDKEPVPIAVAFTPPEHDRLLWSACWQCAGQGGEVQHTEDGQLTVVQQ